ncbi:MAG: DRTGG domain-containing protein [Candidatus Bipolaricaulota bacterium]|nr:DRTGG domain-containing protein [Candidatus Bipolaricaulota bacterium]
MGSLIVASTRESAGKTSVLIGIGRALNKKFGYIKPLGDRFLYRKKRLWDYDAALMVNLFDLGEEPEKISIGFDHSKLRYMYDEESITHEMKQVIAEMEKEKESLFIECGKNLSYGASVHLDPLTLSQATGHQVLIIAGGSKNDIADDLAFLKRFVGSDEAHVGGVIINKVIKLDDFKETYLPEIEALGVNVLGIIPYEKELTTLSVSYLAEKLFARVIAGEDGLNNMIRNVFVGAMSVSAARAEPIFAKPDKLIITSGDRSDMIIAALEAGGTSCVVLTNNIVPPANVTAKASELKIPILLVPTDTYATAMQVDKLEPLLTKDDKKKIEIITRLVKENVNLAAIEAL